MEKCAQFVRTRRTSSDMIDHLPVVKAPRFGRHLFQNVCSRTTNPVGIWEAVLKIDSPSFQQLRLAFV